MNQKEDVDALGKSRQVSVVLECRETWGLSFHVRVNGDTIRKNKDERVDLGGMKFVFGEVGF